MNKTRVGFLAIVTCLLLTSQVAVAETKVQLWKESAGPAFEQFDGWMKANGATNAGGEYKLSHLAAGAYRFAKAQGHLGLVPRGNRSQPSYQALFLRWNGLKGESIPQARFRAKGTGAGFWLPVIDRSVTSRLKVARVNAQAVSDKKLVRRIEWAIDLVKTEKVNGGDAVRKYPETFRSVWIVMEGINQKVAAMDSRVAENHILAAKWFGSLGRKQQELFTQMADMNERLVNVEDGLVAVGRIAVDAKAGVNQNASEIIDLKKRFKELEDRLGS